MLFLDTLYFQRTSFITLSEGADPYGLRCCAPGIGQRNEAAEKRTAFNAGHYRDYPFRWILRGIPGDPGYHVPQRTGLYAAVPESPLVHSPEKQPVHDPDLHGVLHGGGIPLCIRYCPVGCSL